MREWLSGRVSPCQGEGREFESRFPLHTQPRPAGHVSYPHPYPFWDK